MDRGAWQAPVHGVAKSWTLLKGCSMNTRRFLAGWAPFGAAVRHSGYNLPFKQVDRPAFKPPSPPLIHPAAY